MARQKNHRTHPDLIEQVWKVFRIDCDFQNGSRTAKLQKCLKRFIRDELGSISQQSERLFGRIKHLTNDEDMKKLNIRIPGFGAATLKRALENDEAKGNNASLLLTDTLGYYGFGEEWEQQVFELGFGAAKYNTADLITDLEISTAKFYSLVHKSLSLGNQSGAEITSHQSLMHQSLGEVELEFFIEGTLVGEAEYKAAVFVRGLKMPLQISDLTYIRELQTEFKFNKVYIYTPNEISDQVFEYAHSQDFALIVLTKQGFKYELHFDPESIQIPPYRILSYIPWKSREYEIEIDDELLLNSSFPSTDENASRYLHTGKIFL